MPVRFSRRLAAPRVVSSLAAVLGLLCLADAFRPGDRHVIHAFTQLLPASVTETTQAVVGVSGLLLLRMASGLRRGRRREWWVAVVTCAALAVVHLARERHAIEIVVTVLLLAALLAGRKNFTATSDPYSRRVAARLGLFVIALALPYGMALLYLPGHVAGNVSFFARLREVVFSLAGWGGTISVRGANFSDAVHGSLLGFGLAAGTICLVVALRPSAPRATMPTTDEQRLRCLLDRHGDRDSLGYFALRRDKSVVWSPSGKAAVTYRVVNGVALASGDPVGDPEAWPGALHRFAEEAQQHGWIPAAIGCSERAAEAYRRELGLTALALGDEAVIDVATFNLEGRAMRSIRQACRRVERAGYVLEVRRVGDVPAEEIEDARRAAEQWRTDPVERGYSMALSRLGDPADGDCLLATARKDGALRGVLHFVPWGSDGLSLDLMRRERSADNGLNEFMISGVVAAAAGLGVGRISLNFAVFREALERGQRVGAGPVAIAWRRALLLASRWWQIDSLYRFNAKFLPTWQPRFLSFPSYRDAPRVALAALEAESFVVGPRRLRRLLGRA